MPVPSAFHVRAAEQQRSQPAPSARREVVAIALRLAALAAASLLAAAGALRHA